MHPNPPNTDADGYYIPPDTIDRTPDKIYARLNKPEGGALITTAWVRHFLYALVDDFYRLADEPTKDYLTQAPIRFRDAQNIPEYLDQGHILETETAYLRRDEDDGHKLPSPPAGLESYWREVF